MIGLAPGLARDLGQRPRPRDHQDSGKGKSHAKEGPIAESRSALHLNDPKAEFRGAYSRHYTTVSAETNQAGGDYPAVSRRGAALTAGVHNRAHSPQG